MNFTINKDQIARLKVLSDYAKKMENFSSLDKKQVFFLDNDKLTIFGRADTGHIEASFDVMGKSTGSFGFELDKFIRYLEKMGTDEVNIGIANDKISFKSKGTKQTINEALVFTALEASELDELKNYITSKLGLDEFKSPTEVKLEHKDLIADIASLTKIQDTNRQISLGGKTIKTADNLCILSVTTQSAIVGGTDSILLDREVVNIFKHADNFKISDAFDGENRYYYFDITNFGIKLMFVPRAFPWSFPTENDVAGIIPVDTKQITLEIDSERFYAELAKFDGVYEASTWRYGQVKFDVPVGFKDEVALHYDNLVTEMYTTLPVTIVENTDNNDGFLFMLPTIHFKSLRALLTSEATFKLKLSSSKSSDPNGLGVVFQNSLASIVIAKMEEN